MKQKIIKKVNEKNPKKLEKMEKISVVKAKQSKKSKWQKCRTQPIYFAIQSKNKRVHNKHIHKNNEEDYEKI